MTAAHPPSVKESMKNRGQLEATTAPHPQVVNGELPATFRKWYPTFAAANEPCAAAA